MILGRALGCESLSFDRFDENRVMSDENQASMEDFFAEASAVESQKKWLPLGKKQWSSEFAELTFDPYHMAPEKASSAFVQLLKEIPWSQGSVKVYGKTHPTPRLECWMGEPDALYQYSSQSMTPKPWHALVWSLKQELELLTSWSFNACLLNCYRDGRDHVGWHADDEPELGHDPCIASLSFGAQRRFDLKCKPQSNGQPVTLRAEEASWPESIVLSSGSLLTMAGAFQDVFLHRIPKQHSVTEARINLTFRKVRLRGEG